MNQNAIELQKIELKRPQRITTMSKLLDVTNEAENHFRDELELVSNYKYANSISTDSRTKNVESKLPLEAKGQTVSKFMIKIHPQALERRIRHKEVQQRREAFEYERKLSRIVNEDKKVMISFENLRFLSNFSQNNEHYFSMKQCLLEEKEKRQRIKDYVYKRLAEKEYKIMNAQQRMKSLIDFETAKEFDHKRLLTHVMSKFRNIIQWKIRNQDVSIEMRRRTIFRHIFVKWEQHINCVWGERKKRAIAFDNRHCLKVAWSRWRQQYLITQSNKWTAVDWFNLRLSERIFQAWNRVTAQTRHLFEIKKMQADTHFNW